ncbi:hypothetical protein BD413DRAFT_477961 [Trametes elegans]|nr:hypothetical protein BD413DRAFT_477961 [Trametes elegans]
MFAFAALVSTTLALASSVVADPHRTPAHWVSSQNSSLVFAPQSASNGADLVASLAGDGSADDITALWASSEPGNPTQLIYGEWCITANGVEPGSATQTLYVAECDFNDKKQYWLVSAETPTTVSNADGNCITLGRAAKGVPVSLAECNDVLQHLQLWTPVPVDSA